MRRSTAESPQQALLFDAAPVQHEAALEAANGGAAPSSEPRPVGGAPTQPDGGPVAPRPGLRPVEEHEDPGTIAAQIGSNLRDALAVMGDLERDLSTKGAPITAGPWIVFVRADGEHARPAMLDAVNRWAAERKVSSALGLPVSACFAIPAVLASNIVAAIPLEEHPRCSPEPEDLGDAIAHALEGAIAATEVETTGLQQALADTLGITVAELEARDAAAEEKRVAEAAAKTEKKGPRAAPKMKATKPAPGSAPLDASRRVLVPRQIELLALVEVDPRSNRVVYTRNEHLPDWPLLKQAVEAIGGVYRGKGKKVRGGWVFPDEIDAADAIAQARASGTVFDPTVAGLFETTDALADELVARITIRRGDRVLEPSAGKRGSLAQAVRRACVEAEIVCVEVMPDHVEELRALGFNAIAADFLKLGPADLGGAFDVVVANPPFGAGRVELHHLRHMLGFLSPRGRLAAIMPQSIRFRDDAATVEVRNLLETHGATYADSPRGAFREAGTMCSTVSVWMTKRDR